MVRNIIIIIVSLLCLLLSACAPQAAIQQAEEETVCNSPYIEYKKGECCLDINSNSVCDSDEKEEKSENRTETIVCNKPYILVKDDCCLDENNNSICDSDERPAEKDMKKSSDIAQEALDSVVVILSRTENYAHIGSGFFMAEDGYLITNFHVVYDDWDKEDAYTAQTNFGKNYTLEFIGASDYLDFAILKVKKPDRKFEYLTVAEDSGKPGDVVYALGNPYGEDFSVSKGIISQKNRQALTSDLDKYAKYLQLDAAINPGNSGGPIINEDGDVVGMSTYIFRGAEGLGYGLQSEEVDSLFDDKIFRNMSILRDVSRPSLKEISDDVIFQPSSVYLTTSEADRTVYFNGFTLQIENKGSKPVYICYDVELMDYWGHKTYDEFLSKTSVVKPNSKISERIKDGAIIDSGYLHYYHISLVDCTTEELLATVSGEGIYNFEEYYR